MNSFLNKNTTIYVGFSFILICLFGLKDILILFSDTWPHLYSVVNVPRAHWEEIYCYLPFAGHFSLDNIMPAAPMAYPGHSQFSFFPILTLISQGIILKCVCFSNIDIYLLSMHTIFPMLSFWIIFLVFNRYIAVSWSLLFTLLGVTTFPNFSFLPYLFNIGINPSVAVQTASLSPMELTRTPIPSFTFFFFILSFYLSTREIKPTKLRCYCMSVLWALNLYIYLFNFIAGILFWGLYLIYTCFIRDRTLIFVNVAKTILPNLFIVLFAISPVLIKRFFLQTPLDVEIFQKMELVSRGAGFIINDWGAIYSYLVPILAVFIVIWIYCADYYELFYKFTPVFIVILVEIFVSNLHIVLGEFVQPELFNIRIADYFMRFFYFIPIIYFLSRPYKKLFHHQAKHKFSDKIHIFCDRYINQKRVLISVIGILAASFFCIFSTLRYVNHFCQSVAPRMEIVEKEYRDLSSFIRKGEGMITSEDIPVNLLIPVLSTQETLLVNAFTNYISSDEILNRLILYAKIFNWDNERFIDFMMPSEEYNKFNTENAFLLTDTILKKGFGYWLLNHRKQMNADELKEYRDKIVRFFHACDVMADIRKYKIKAVQTFQPINPVIPIQSVVKRAEYTIYLLGEI